MELACAYVCAHAATKQKNTNPNEAEFGWRSDKQDKNYELGIYLFGNLCPPWPGIL